MHVFASERENATERNCCFSFFSYSSILSFNCFFYFFLFGAVTYYYNWERQKSVSLVSDAECECVARGATLALGNFLNISANDLEHTRA